MKLCARKERLDLQEKRLDLQEKMSDLQKRGKICNICTLINVRIVKSLRSESFVLCKNKISEKFCF
jgi:hypothetical protein